jgi:hypothetical protein
MYPSDMSLTRHNVSTQQTLPANELAVQQLNSNNDFPECYQSDHRYICKDNCCWKSGCKALTATWLRKN